MPAEPHVIVIGGGFAGVGLIRELAGHENVRITLIDSNNYHQFQPLLYQVATSQLAPGDVAFSLRRLFEDHENVDIKMATAQSVDPVAHTVTTTDGHVYEGDVVVIAAGSQANFFRTPGAREHAFPLYSLPDAEVLRSRIIGVFEDADRDPSLVEQGALNFVVVGGGPTGVEMAGALAELIEHTMVHEYNDLAVSAAEVHLVDLGQHLLAPFSETAHDYAAKVLGKRGVRIHMGTAVSEVSPGHVTLADGNTIRTRCVVWGGGIKGPEIATAAGVPQGRGGRIDVESDLTVAGFPGVYAIGDAANVPAPDGSAFPQLGSVALQSGTWAAHNLIADFGGRQRKPFHYKDKGIMAMIGRGAAIAEVGPHRHELHGVIAFSAWIGVHAMLMTGVRNRIDAFVTWAWDYFSDDRGPQVLDRTSAARIGWGGDRVLSSCRDHRVGVGLEPRGRPQPDGLHAGVPHHPGVAGRRAAGDDADRQLQGTASRRRRRAAAGAAVVEGCSRDLRGRSRHRHRAVVRVRAALARLHRPLWRRVRGAVRDRGDLLLPRGDLRGDLHLRLEAPAAVGALLGGRADRDLGPWRCVLGGRREFLDEPAARVLPGQRDSEGRRSAEGHLQPSGPVRGAAHDPRGVPGHRLSRGVDLRSRNA